jgi:hypothetical protein
MTGRAERLCVLLLFDVPYFVPELCEKSRAVSRKGKLKYGEEGEDARKNAGTFVRIFRESWPEDGTKNRRANKTLSSSHLGR